MARYLALIDHDDATKSFGAVFPDCPGCTAMGATFDEAHENAIEALREWIADRVGDSHGLPAARDVVALRSDPDMSDDFTPTTIIVSVPVYIDGGRPVRVNVSMEAGLVAAIDDAAKMHGLTRSAFLASAAREKIATSR